MAGVTSLCAPKPCVRVTLPDGSAVALRPLEPEADVPHVLEAVRLLRKELSVPLIGFAGAPFTLASYLIEGGPSRSHVRAKTLMLTEPRTWAALMEALGEMATTHLRAQVEAQLSKTWIA